MCLALVLVCVRYTIEMLKDGEERRLEVVILYGTLQDAALAGRVKVSLSICAASDPEGEKFGLKVSPWTPPGPDGQFRFGRSGLRALFNLGRSGPQELIADPRFLESAELLIELWVSSAPPVSEAAESFWQGAAKLLQGAQDSLDQNTRTLAGSLRLPLANVLCGRGLAADRALGGWIQLGADGPGLWMQSYVLPDHQAVLSQLEAQLQAAAQKCSVSVPDASPAAAAAERSAAAASSQGSKSALGAGPWGPKQATAGATAKKSAAPDLLSFDAPSDPGNSLMTFDSSSGKAATLSNVDLLGSGQTEFAPPNTGVHDSNFNSLANLNLLDDSSLVDIPLDADATPTKTSMNEDASSFSFLNGGSSGAATGYVNSSASAFAFTSSQPTNTSNSSAFSFTQGPTPNGIVDSSSRQNMPGQGLGNLDLGSLYAAAAEEPMPSKSVSTSNYSALSPGLSNDFATQHLDVGVKNSAPGDFEALQKATMDNLFK